MKMEHWYEEDGPLTEVARKELLEAVEAQAKESGLRPVLIENEHGIYVAPHGATPGDGERYFESE